MLQQPNDVPTLFYVWQLHAVFERRRTEMLYDVENMNPDVFLKEDLDTLAESLFKKYEFVAPRLRFEDRYMDPAQEIDIEPRGTVRPTQEMFEGAGTVKGARITVRVPFDGQPQVFNWRPTTYDPSGQPSAYIGDGELSFVYETTDTDPAPLNTFLEDTVASIERYLGWLRKDFPDQNLALLRTVKEVVGDRQGKLRGQRSLEEGLSIPLKRTTPPEMYEIPMARRETPLAMPTGTSTGRAPDPTMPDRHYEHILSVLSSMALTMERSPSAFRALGEEDLRWHFVLVLNGHYEGGATGETFNAGGKTDILVGWEGRNIFIGECKFWEGPKSLEKAVDQLFDYATWRDTKTAILVFNRNKGFSRVLAQIPEVLRKHRAFEEQLEGSGKETEFRFRLRHPQDPEHELTLTVLAFDVPSDHAATV